MAFNFANITFTGDINNPGRTYKWSYTTGDDKSTVQGGNYFPKGVVRTGDVVVVDASDGNMILLATEVSNQVSVFVVLEY